MSRKRYTQEQIIGMLREAEVCLSPGETKGQICRHLGVFEQNYYLYGRLSRSKLIWISLAWFARPYSSLSTASDW